MNALIDRPMIRLLYQAAQAGVRVDLIVRGMCCLCPGISGLSETIRVTSVVGRFLEHSRIYYFRNGGAEQIYLGSADLMPRNLDRRVEILFPIQDARLIRRLRDEILATYLADNSRARLMHPDGKYKRLAPEKDAAPLDSQAALLNRAFTAVPI
jgi:polyphosphate kinase